MRKTIILVSSAVVTSFLFTGCATLFGGGANQALSNAELNGAVHDRIVVERNGVVSLFFQVVNDTIYGNRFSLCMELHQRTKDSKVLDFHFSRA